MSHDQKERITSAVAAWAPIFISILCLATFWGMMKSDTLTLKESVSAASVKIDGHETRISKVEQAVIEIPEIRKDIKELLRRVR
jgi:hypothetical protein